MPLSSKYKKYYVYNHIKGASHSEKKYTWQSLGVNNRVNVYLDMRGVKQGTSSSWYRLRFYQNTKAKKFWVYAPALSFAQTYYGSTSGRLTPNVKSAGKLYNHVVGTPTLAKSVTKLKSLKPKKRQAIQSIKLPFNLPARDQFSGIEFLMVKLKAGLRAAMSRRILPQLQLPTPRQLK